MLAMYSNGGSLGSGTTSDVTSWTMRFQGEDNGAETATIQDGSTVGSGTDEDDIVICSKISKSRETEARETEAIEQVLSSSPSCKIFNGSWVCHPYKIEQLERQLFNNSPGVGRRTAIIETLRQSEFLVCY